MLFFIVVFIVIFIFFYYFFIVIYNNYDNYSRNFLSFNFFGWGSVLHAFLLIFLREFSFLILFNPIFFSSFFLFYIVLIIPIVCFWGGIIGAF